MKTYKSFTIQSNSEILLAQLSMFAFESFEEHDGYMIGYIPQEECDGDIESQIDELIKSSGASYEISIIKPQNWNAIWEASFTPVIVESFCAIRADFHEKNPNVTHDIIVNPKMAFGTGHHETTYMMMSAMKDLNISNKTVFDYGCGTGVLAILASKMGAGPIDAIDIEEESFENTKENCVTNGVNNVSVACSDLESFPSKKYDLILANINRNVLLNSAEELWTRLESNGQILISGILDEDESLVKDKFINSGFTIINQLSRGYWKCLHFVK